MKTFLKFVAFLFGLFVLLIMAGTLAIKIYFPPAKVKKLVLDTLSVQLKREVTLGNVSIGLWSGLQLADLKISEAPNFSKGTFVSSDLLSIKIALKPLLSKKVVVREIALTHPEVTVIRNADGKTFNFSDLIPKTPANAPAKAAYPVEEEEGYAFIPSAYAAVSAPPVGNSAPSALAVTIARAQIREGKLRFVDRSPAKQSIDISPFDLTVDGFSTSSPFKADLAMHLKSQGKDLAVHVGGETDLVKETFKITTGDLALGQIKATITGLISQFSSPEPVIKLHLDTNNIPIQELLMHAPAPLPPDVSLDGTTKLAVDLSGTASNAQFAAKWTGTDMKIAKGEDFLKPAGLPLEFSAIGSRSGDGKIVFKSLLAKVASNEVVGSGSMEPRGKDNLIQFAFHGANWSVADLAKMAPLVARFQPSGTLSFDLKTTGLASAPQTIVQTSAKINLANILHEFYEGKNLEMQWNLSDITPDLSKVSGVANLKQGPGRILNVEKLAASSKAGKMALAPVETLAKLQKKGVLKQVNLPSLQNIPFDSIIGDYICKAGIMTIKNFNLEGKDMSIQNHGTVGLAGVQPINLVVAMKLAAGSMGGSLGTILNDEAGRPTVKFTATGSVANPQVKFDTKEVGQKAVKEILKNKDVQNAVEDLQKQFKGIFH